MSDEALELVIQLRDHASGTLKKLLDAIKQEDEQQARELLDGFNRVIEACEGENDNTDYSG